MLISLDEKRWGMIELPKNNLTMIDLFCGAGIGACGAKLAGYTMVYAIDNKEYAVKTYNKNIGNHAVVKDIRTLNGKDIPDADVVMGGFPCQPFSIAGRGEGVNDLKQGDLGYHFYRIIKEKKPKVFIMENVPGIINKNHKDFFDNLLKLFENENYDITWDLINCWEYGVPQLRKRVFVIGIRKDLNVKFKFPEKIPEKNRTTIRDAIGDLPDPNDILNHKGYGIRNDEKEFIDKIPPGGNWRSLNQEDQKNF